MWIKHFFYDLYDSDDYVFQPGPVGIVVQNERSIFGSFSAPEGRGFHARI